jgi:maltose alpha-D-glucosyltransferase/alpha-amylase
VVAHREDLPSADDPQWYKDAVIYELHVKTFYDSNGDGIGDFPGVIEKLDYLADLGVTAIWLLPFYPSPLRDDGYDIADYWLVNPSYGTLKDFKRFLKEAHARGMRVITELVINHTSDQHAWFQRARKAPKGSRFRDWYVWSDDPELYRGTRIIFQDFERSNWTWDEEAGQYYWHRFYHHQPDLNFDNPDVEKAVFKVFDYWMDMGIDGMRLDAVPYLYERENTNCENLPETHQFLKRLRKHIDSKYDGRMLLAEANQWPEDAAQYFGDGDECHMNFHFPLMPRMFMSVQLENSFPISDILQQTPKIHDSAQWAVFLRNHDELTLEMVTDEDRDYMYRMYAADPRARINLGIRRRLAPLMQDRVKIELMNGLLFSMPGTPVLYYGDEIGMGDNIYLGDRDGVRTPMQWSNDRNAGFSQANPQRLYLPTIIDPEYHYEATNVEAQQNNPASLLWWMKRIIALRNQYRVFGRGTIELLDPENPKVLAFIRAYENEQVLIVANLSRFAQFTELDLRAYAGATPVELFGGTEFPAVGDLPYLLALGPHQFYWFELKRPEQRPVDEAIPSLDVTDGWERLLTGRPRKGFTDAVLRYVQERRWFRGKSRRIKSGSVVDVNTVATDEGKARLALVRIEYRDHEPESYLLPLAYATGEAARTLEEEQGFPLVARIRTKKGAKEEHGILYDPFARAAFSTALLRSFEKRRAVPAPKGQLVSSPSRRLRELRAGTETVDLEPWHTGAEQTNSSVIYGHEVVLKLFRLLEDGHSPELEFLTYLESVGFPHAPRLEGSIAYEREGKTSTVAVLQRFVPNQGDTWRVTLDSLGRYFDRALAHVREVPEPPIPTESLIELVGRTPGELEAEVLGPYLPLVALLGRRTAELHVALAQGSDDKGFAPEAMTELHQRSLYQSARTRLGQTFKRLRKRGALQRVPEEQREEAEELLARQDEVDALLRRILDNKIDAVRTRCHGDYHLGQVLYTGKDFVIIDFEGEPARPIGERRFKRSPLVDVAGMLRSFHYATMAALHHGSIRHEDHATLAPWGELWHRWVGATFLTAYLEAASSSPILPKDPEDLRTLLEFFVLDKCVYELGYELDNRPTWLGIPLHGLAALL